MRLGVHVVGFAGVALLFGAAVRAQEQRGAIEGVVRDAHGAPVPGASVLALSAIAVETLTGGSGVYRFASLPPGRYEVAAGLSGFRPARVVNVDLRLGQQLEIDVRLEPAGPDETVEVVSESPLVAIRMSGGRRPRHGGTSAVRGGFSTKEWKRAPDLEGRMPGSERCA